MTSCMRAPEGGLLPHVISLDDDQRSLQNFRDDTMLSIEERVARMCKVYLLRSALRLASSASAGRDELVALVLRRAELGDEPAVPVTVAIPCFNGAEYLPRVADGIRQQSIPVARVLLVDDGSTDKTAEVAEKLGFTVIAHGTNRGLPVARNTAIDACDTALIALIDADVELDRYWLERLLKFKRRGGHAGVSGKLTERYSLTPADEWRSVVMAQHYGMHPREEINIYGCNALFDVAALRSVGGYDPSFRYAYEDINISERLRAAGYRLAYNPAAAAYHLRRDSPVSVVDTCYKWRRPPFERAGAFNSLERLAKKWEVSVRADIGEIHELQVTERHSLVGISLLCLFRSLVLDLVSFHQNRPFRAEILEATFAAIANGLGGLTDRELRRYVSELIAAPISALAAIKPDEIALRALNAFRQGLLNTEVATAPSELAAVLEPLPDVIRFAAPIEARMLQALRPEFVIDYDLPTRVRLEIGGPSPGILNFQQAGRSVSLSIPGYESYLETSERLAALPYASFDPFPEQARALALRVSDRLGFSLEVK